MDQIEEGTAPKVVQTLLMTIYVEVLEHRHEQERQLVSKVGLVHELLSLREDPGGEGLIELLFLVH